jgi:hypothetical protein
VSQVCKILEKAGLWQGSLPFDDAVQPMFYKPHMLDQLTQERLDAALLDALNAMDVGAGGHAIKRGYALCFHNSMKLRSWI